MDERYRIEVLHIVNPHVIFIESQSEGIRIEQVGVYGVLPVNKTVDIDGRVVTEGCENWPVAATTLLRDFFADCNNCAYFLPIQAHERSTIFDENIHKFGDIIVIVGQKQISITKHLVKLSVAIKDDHHFQQQLSSGSLKIKLNSVRTEEVLNAIKKYYKKQKRVEHDWQKTISQQTSLHQESKKISAELTERNLKMHTLSVMGTIERKDRDLNLCKDADMVSVGCGNRRKSSKVKNENSNDSEPLTVLNEMKKYFVAHGRTKGSYDDFRQKSDSTNNHSTPLKGGDASDNYEENYRNDNRLKPIPDKNKIHKQHKEEDTVQQKKTSPLKYDTQEDMIHDKCMKNHNEDEALQSCAHEMTRLAYSGRGGNDIQTSSRGRNNYGVKQATVSDTTKAYKDVDSTHYEEIALQTTKKKFTVSSKPKERFLVFCPDMEMSNDNLKHFIPQKIVEDFTTDYSKSQNVSDTPKDAAEPMFDDVDQDSNVCIEIGKRDKLRQLVDNKTYDQTDSNENNDHIHSQAHLKKHNKENIHIKSQNIKETDNTAPTTKQDHRLVSSILRKKLQALKHSQTTLVNSSSNSDTSVKDTSSTDNSKVDMDEPKCESRLNLETEKQQNKPQLKKKLKLHQRNMATQPELKTKPNQSENDSNLLEVEQKTKPNQVENNNNLLELEQETKPNQLQNANNLLEVEKEQPKLEPELPTIPQVQPKLAQEIVKVERNVNPFKNLDGSKSVFVEKLVTPILMVHTKNDNLILPQCDLRDIPFKRDTHCVLKSMKIHKPKRLQSVSWTYILRGHSMFMISPAGNGKTLGYLPAVCNLVTDSLKEIDGVGPICVIVCATALSVTEIETYCKRFLDVGETLIACYHGLDFSKITTSLLNGCHILVCTAPMLVSLLEIDFGVDLRRLMTLVFDDCERLSQVYSSELNKILQHVKIMLKNRSDKSLKVQYVVASRQWCDFMTPLAKNAPDSIIAIGASQECVLYSKTKTSVNFVLNQESKVNAVVDFMQEIDNSKRTVIVCREDNEVDLLERTLKTMKHTVFACNSSMDLHDLYKLNEAWGNYEEPVLGPVLICCDGNLTHFNITNANYLVHYSMPALFSMFSKRFSVLNENYASIFGPENDNVKIKILLDETNVEQLPKILHFVKRCTKKEFPMLDKVLQEVMEEKDLKKAENLTPICNNLLMLGKCVDIWNCLDRHTGFNEFDEPKDWMPKQGTVTFKIIHHDSAVTYSARLLGKMTNSGSFKYPNNYKTLPLKMGRYYSKEANRKMHGIPKVGDVCAVAVKQNFFERCKVMKVIPIDNRSSHVLINLIDEEQLTLTRDVQLYYLPDDLKAIETHVVKVRLANLKPKDNDVTFSVAAKDYVQQITEHDHEQNLLYIRGRVTMTLGNCIFVDSAEACADLSSLGETVVKRDLKKDLLQRHAEPNPHHIENLKKLRGAVLAEENIPAVTSKVEKRPRWAHLDKDELSTVYFANIVDAGTIFVRHEKFDKVVGLLHKDIQEYAENAVELAREEICVGNFVLAEVPDDKTYERARIDEIKDETTAKCFFVDNGDWRHVSLNKLKPIPDNILHRLPFQAIECRLVGIKPPGDAEDWPEFSTCWLDDNYCFEDNDGNMKCLFVKYFTKEKALITGGHKYGVVLFDTSSDEDLVVNKLIIELNLAKENEDESKYLIEPLKVKPVKITDSSSDDDNSSGLDNSNTERLKTNINDLVPFKENAISSIENPSTAPRNILFEKPIRSVPLVDDSDSDISDKWDVVVDKDMLGIFGQASKSHVNKDTTDEKGSVSPDIPNVEKSNESKIDNSVLGDVDAANNNIKISDTVSSVSSSVSNLNNKEIAQSILTTPLNLTQTDSDDTMDTDIGNDKLEALNIFKNKICNNEFTEKSVKKPELVNQQSKNYAITETDTTRKELRRNETLDSDDLSSVSEIQRTEAITKVIEIDATRKPKIVWRQNIKSVTLKINLIGVEGYDLDIKERRLKFNAWHNDTTYEFDIELYSVIKPQQSSHSNKGQYIQVNLTKMLQRNWLNLTKDFTTKKWIVYDVDAIEFSSDEEEHHNDELKVIKQNHELSESSEDDELKDDLNFTYSKILQE